MFVKDTFDVVNSTAYFTDNGFQFDIFHSSIPETEIQIRALVDVHVAQNNSTLQNDNDCRIYNYLQEFL